MSRRITTSFALAGTYACHLPPCELKVAFQDTPPSILLICCFVLFFTLSAVSIGLGDTFDVYGPDLYRHNTFNPKHNDRSYLALVSIGGIATPVIIGK